MYQFSAWTGLFTSFAQPLYQLNDILWLEQRQNVIRLRLKLWPLFNFWRFLAFRISTIRFQWVVENYSLPRDQIASLKQQFNITDRFSRFLVFNSPTAVFKDGLLRAKLPILSILITFFQTNDPWRNSVRGSLMTPRTVWR